MKSKIYHLVTIFVLILISLNTLGQAKKILFVSNTNPAVPEDSVIIDSIKIWGYDVITVDAAEFADTSYASFDAVYISESISSSGANSFQEAAYPIPVFCSEPYVVNANRWGWIDHKDTTLRARHDAGTDALITVITDNSHYITQEYSNFDEVVWSTETEYPDVPSFIAFDISIAVPGAIPLGKSKASEINYTMGLHTLWAIPEGSTVTDASESSVTLPRMVFYNTHTVALGVGKHTAGLNNIIHRSLRWLLEEGPGVGLQNSIDAFSGVQLLSNPVRDNARIRFNLDQPGIVSVSVVNLMGQEIAVPIREYYPAGTNEISFNTSELNSGMYLYKLRVNNNIYCGNMLVFK